MYENTQEHWTQGQHLINVNALPAPPDHHFPHYSRACLPAKVRREQLFMWKGKGKGVSIFLEAQTRQRRWVRRVLNELEAPKGDQCICKRES